MFILAEIKNGSAFPADFHHNGSRRINALRGGTEPKICSAQAQKKTVDSRRFSPPLCMKVATKLFNFFELPKY
jgi:hypothetical protein